MFRRDEPPQRVRCPIRRHLRPSGRGGDLSHGRVVRNRAQMG